MIWCRHSAAESAECSFCSGVDKGIKEAIADSGEQGVEADFGCTNVHTCGSIAERGGGINSGDWRGGK